MSKYPTDEELEKFIRQLEQQELYAPVHIREQVLNRAFPKQTEQPLSKSGSGPGKSQILAYRLKIIVGMAAAIFILFLLPSMSMDGRYDSMEETKGWEKENSLQEEENPIYINSELNERARRVNQKINDWFEKIDILQGGNLYDY